MSLRYFWGELYALFDNKHAMLAACIAERAQRMRQPLKLLPVRDREALADSERWQEGETFKVRETYTLCRCGHSGTKPFCDGTHGTIGFDGTETASHEPYLEQATMLEGPALSLSDAKGLCAFGRFCDPHGNVWNEVARTDEPATRERFLRQVQDCPAGRLVAWDNTTDKPLEPQLPVSIGLIEDPPEKCSGPIWLRGGIPVVSADGFAYEVRNRVTLCRCGASKNKPFCDGAHASIGFRDR